MSAKRVILRAEHAEGTLDSPFPTAPTPRNPDDHDALNGDAPIRRRPSFSVPQQVSEIQGQTRQLLAAILGENQGMLADIGQEMGEGMNEIMSSNDQFFRDIFGEGMDTLFRRPQRARASATARRASESSAVPATRMIAEGAIEAEIVDDSSATVAERSRGPNAVDVLEAEVVAESVDSGSQIIRETGADVRTVARLPRPMPNFAVVAAQAAAEMRTRHRTNIADRPTKLDRAVADRRAKLDRTVADRKEKLDQAVVDLRAKRR